MARARRIVRRTALGVAVTGLAGVVVLGAEAWRATQRRYLGAESAVDVGGQFGAGGDTSARSRPLRLAILGDSTAAGVGATSPGTTVAVRLAEALAAGGQQVSLTGLGVSGARVRDLDKQVDRALMQQPDIAVVLIGANDSRRLVDLDELGDHISAAVRRLRAPGAQVVVGTCPDMGAVTAIDRPLRDLLGWLGRRVGRASQRAARDAGALAVDLAAETGPAFRAHPERYLSKDEFHPSDEGYRLWAEALLPSVLAAAGSIS